LLSTLVRSYCQLNVEYPADRSATIEDEDEFDFIVVGAGSAGSVIANRLSEVTRWRILLIEAGPDPPIESEIPALYSAMIHTKYDWYYRTERSEIACLAMVNNQCVQPKGKMLGGSSSINAMFYVRGNEGDYDRWRAAGNPGWSYKDVLKYFKKLEHVDDPRTLSGIHGRDGPQHANYVSKETYYHTQTVERMIREAAVEEGLPSVDDCTSNVRPCVTEPLFTVDKAGTRTSAAKAYLASAKERQNLVIMKESLATKLLIDEEEKRVYGVEVHVNGKFVQVRSRKEVIVSAGSIASPQLLMLSGIGPKEHLESLGIHVTSDLKVGYNLQDHIYLSNFYAKLNLSDDPPPMETDPLYLYLTRRNDTFAVPLRPPSLLFANSENGTARPNIQFHFRSSPRKNPFVTSYLNSLNFKPEITRAAVALNRDHHLLSMYVKLIQPKSRGRVALSSSNPFVTPVITNGYLTEREDVKVLIEGVKLAARMMRSKAIGSVPYTLPVPECDKLAVESDAFYECYIRHFTITVYHMVGTCKMGPKSDAEAVVDAALKVYGVRGLRVADASVMPTIVSGNSNVPTMMIGEKASDMIKKEWLAMETGAEL
jgi:choline dehydrogenase-like flavoprotein